MTRYLIDLSLFGCLRFLFAEAYVFIRYLVCYAWYEVPCLFKEVSKYKNSKNNRKAFVFANGPSLSKIDPYKVSRLVDSGEYDLFGVNSYVSSSFGQIAKPTHYVLSDPVHFGLVGQTGPDAGGKACHPDVKNLQDLQGITLFVPSQFRKWISQISNVIPFCDREAALFFNSTDIRWPRCFCSMTAFKAIQIACYLGYEKIYIAGFDNNYFKTISVDEDNQMWEVDAHHYNQGGVKRKICQPAYFCSNMAEYLACNSMLFKDLYQFQSSKIFNLIGNSLVDAFPKTSSLDVYAVPEKEGKH